MTLPIIDFVFIILIVAISIFALVNGFIKILFFYCNQFQNIILTVYQIRISGMRFRNYGFA